MPTNENAKLSHSKGQSLLYNQMTTVDVSNIDDNIYMINSTI